MLHGLGTSTLMSSHVVFNQTLTPVSGGGKHIPKHLLHGLVHWPVVSWNLGVFGKRSVAFQ